MHQIHQYEVVLQYSKGKSMLLSDCLSRNCEYEKNKGSNLEDLETRLVVADIEASTYISQSALEDTAQATQSDAMLRDITEFIVHGWPEMGVGLPVDLQLYNSLRDELAYHAGCVVKGNRLVVPEALRETILQRLHRTHLDMSKMKTPAQEIFYWPKVHRSIESFVLR